MGLIGRLSQIETRLSEAFPVKILQGERDFASVAAARQEHALPILEQFRAWVDREKDHGQILPKNLIRTAFTYTLNQWDSLCRYTEEGYLSFDNNVAERLVEIPAIGRKNYLFVGSEAGGHSTAVLYSLVSSAKANGVEPFAWLRDLFTRLPYHRHGEAFAQAKRNKPASRIELDASLPRSLARRQFRPHLEDRRDPPQRTAAKEPAVHSALTIRTSCPKSVQSFRAAGDLEL